MKRKYDPRNFLSNGQGIISVNEDSEQNSAKNSATYLGAGWIVLIVALSLVAVIVAAVVARGRGGSCVGRSSSSYTGQQDGIESNYVSPSI